MTLPFVVLGAIGAALAAKTAYDYLFPNNELPTVGETTPTPDSPPYVPPFTGGQCTGVQYETVINGQVKFGIGSNLEGQIQSTFVNAVGHSVSEPISVARLEIRNGNAVWVITNQLERTLTSTSPIYAPLDISGLNVTVRRADLAPDTCGDLPDPNASPPPPIPDGGIPQNGTPAISPNDELVEAGLPVVFAPSVLAALAGLAISIGQAIAAAQAAADALAATKALADAVKGIADILAEYKETFDELRKYLNKKKKEDDANKQYFIRQFGTILRDGYLDITPRPAVEGFKPLMLDFLCANVPNAKGRFFGIKSYNWFRYEELGSICFLSPTSGVLSIHKIEHVRTSIPIPELAIGFTYNMGLNGVIRARVSMLYTQEKT